jgi:ATP-dependent DNA ligase
VLPTVIPAKLARSLEAFDHADWLFELKHDGFRSLAYIEDDTT